MRNTFTYSSQNFNLKNLLSYSKKFTYSSILLSNKIEDKYSQYQTVVCLGSKKTITSDKNSMKKGKVTSAESMTASKEVYLKAGDGLLIVDSLCHGSAKRINKGERRI